MKFIVKTDQIGTALAQYWQRQYSHETRVEPAPDGVHTQVVEVQGDPHPFWREVCESFVGGWEARAQLEGR